ncbi:MAG: HYR domain-containing protein [Verrucomicrobia bacterium]|nr:HYR domain-containing protein [Verrucomicrobiota bacterium]
MAADNVDGPVSVVASPASGSTFPLGTTTVSLTATDAAGNSANASFAVTVRDTTPPVISADATKTAEATSPTGAVVTFVAIATDTVSGNVPVNASPASGSTFGIGLSSVSLSATDAAGNTASGSILINVRDTTVPVISSLAPSSATLWPPNHKMVPITLTAVASDAVGVASLQIISATSNEPDNGLGDGDTAGDIEITGPLTLNLRAERGGKGNGRVYTITVEAKDAAGNASTKTVTVSVPKTQGGK